MRTEAGTPRVDETGTPPLAPKRSLRPGAPPKASPLAAPPIDTRLVSVSSGGGGKRETSSADPRADPGNSGGSITSPSSLNAGAGEWKPGKAGQGGVSEAQARSGEGSSTGPQEGLQANRASPPGKAPEPAPRAASVTPAVKAVGEVAAARQMTETRPVAGNGAGGIKSAAFSWAAAVANPASPRPPSPLPPASSTPPDIDASGNSSSGSSSCSSSSSSSVSREDEASFPALSPAQRSDPTADRSTAPGPAPDPHAPRRSAPDDVATPTPVGGGEASRGGWASIVAGGPSSGSSTSSPRHRAPPPSSSAPAAAAEAGKGPGQDMSAPAVTKEGACAQDSDTSMKEKDAGQSAMAPKRGLPVPAASTLPTARGAWSRGAPR